MFRFFKRKFFNIYSQTKFSLGSKLRAIFSKEIDENLYKTLEKLFYESDLGVETTTELIEKIKKKKIHSFEEILPFLHQELLSILQTPIPTVSFDDIPYVVLMVGTNGSGKTTTIAKLAKKYRTEHKKILIAAADTYRAAAVEQLEILADRVGCEIVKSQTGADPSSVVFDALEAAKTRKYDMVLIDTAGRLHTKEDLMQELEKIKRICNKQIPHSPHMTLLTIDATTGQNAIDQATIFHSSTPIDGIILTKFDGSASGGIIVAIKKKLNIPVIWVGTGEHLDSLSPFDAESFVGALLSSNE